MKAHESDRLGRDGNVGATPRRPLLFVLIAVLVIGALGFTLRALLRSTEPAIPAVVEISNTPSTSAAVPDRAPAPPATTPDVLRPNVESAPPLPELTEAIGAVTDLTETTPITARSAPQAAATATATALLTMPPASTAPITLATERRSPS